MNLEVIIDRINIKELPEIISSYFKDEGLKKYSNLRSFYNVLLDDINEDVKNSYLNRILKYMSSDTSSVINIIEDFNENVYDEELMTFIKDLVKNINKLEKKEKLYQELLSEVKFNFFDDNYDMVVEAYNEGHYESFIFYLLKHAFAMYQINLPGIMAKRLLDQALTLAYNTEHRSLLLKASSDLGNESATFFVADQLYPKDIDLCCLTFLKLKTNAAALWCIAFELENNHLKEETVLKISAELNDIVNNEEYSKDITASQKTKDNLNEHTMMMAVRIYQYIKDNYHFTKAYNSFGKLMINDYLVYKGTTENTIKKGVYYLKQAIKMGNYNAITNYAIFSYKNPELGDLKEASIEKYLSLSANLGDKKGSTYYGIFLFDHNRFKEGIPYLEYATSIHDGVAAYYLGKYYVIQNDKEKAINYFKESIKNGYFDAAYDLALFYLELNMTDKKVNKELAYNLLNDNINRFSNEIKEKAAGLIDNIN